MPQIIFKKKIDGRPIAPHHQTPSKLQQESSSNINTHNLNSSVAESPQPARAKSNERIQVLSKTGSRISSAHPSTANNKQGGGGGRSQSSLGIQSVQKLQQKVQRSAAAAAANQDLQLNANQENLNSQNLQGGCGGGGGTAQGVKSQSGEGLRSSHKLLMQQQIDRSNKKFSAQKSRLQNFQLYKNSGEDENREISNQNQTHLDGQRYLESYKDNGHYNHHHHQEAGVGPQLKADFNSSFDFSANQNAFGKLQAQTQAQFFSVKNQQQKAAAADLLTKSKQAASSQLYQNKTAYNNFYSYGNHLMGSREGDKQGAFALNRLNDSYGLGSNSNQQLQWELGSCGSVGNQSQLLQHQMMANSLSLGPAQSEVVRRQQLNLERNMDKMVLFDPHRMFRGEQGARVQRMLKQGTSSLKAENVRRGKSCNQTTVNPLLSSGPMPIGLQLEPTLQSTKYLDHQGMLSSSAGGKGWNERATPVVLDRLNHSLIVHSISTQNQHPQLVHSKNQENLDITQHLLAFSNSLKPFYKQSKIVPETMLDEQLHKNKECYILQVLPKGMHSQEMQRRNNNRTAATTALSIASLNQIRNNRLNSSDARLAAVHGEGAGERSSYNLNGEWDAFSIAKNTQLMAPIIRNVENPSLIDENGGQFDLVQLQRKFEDNESNIIHDLYTKHFKHKHQDNNTDQAQHQHQQQPPQMAQPTLTSQQVNSNHHLQLPQRLQSLPMLSQEVDSSIQVTNSVSNLDPVQLHLTQQLGNKTLNPKEEGVARRGDNNTLQQLQVKSFDKKTNTFKNRNKHQEEESPDSPNSHGREIMDNYLTNPDDHDRDHEHSLTISAVDQKNLGKNHRTVSAGMEGRRLNNQSFNQEGEGLGEEVDKGFEKVKYVQYVPKEARVLDKDTHENVINQFFFQTPANINSLNTTQYNLRRLNHTMTAGEQRCLSSHEHARRCNKIKELDVVELQNKAFRQMKIQHQQIFEKPKDERSYKASFFPTCKMPEELKEILKSTQDFQKTMLVDEKLLLNKPEKLANTQSRFNQTKQRLRNGDGDRDSPSPMSKHLQQLQVLDSYLSQKQELFAAQMPANLSSSTGQPHIPHIPHLQLDRETLIQLRRSQLASKVQGGQQQQQLQGGLYNEDTHDSNKVNPNQLLYLEQKFLGQEMASAQNLEDPNRSELQINIRTNNPQTPMGASHSNNNRNQNQNYYYPRVSILNNNNVHYGTNANVDSTNSNLLNLNQANAYQLHNMVSSWDFSQTPISSKLLKLNIEKECVKYHHHQQQQQQQLNLLQSQGQLQNVAEFNHQSGVFGSQIDSQKFQKHDVVTGGLIKGADINLRVNQRSRKNVVLTSKTASEEVFSQMRQVSPPLEQQNTDGIVQQHKAQTVAEGQQRRKDRLSQRLRKGRRSSVGGGKDQVKNDRGEIVSQRNSTQSRPVFGGASTSSQQNVVLLSTTNPHPPQGNLTQQIFRPRNIASSIGSSQMLSPVNRQHDLGQGMLNSSYVQPTHSSMIKDQAQMMQRLNQSAMLPENDASYNYQSNFDQIPQQQQQGRFFNFKELNSMQKKKWQSPFLHQKTCELAKKINLRQNECSNFEKSSKLTHPLELQPSSSLPLSQLPLAMRDLSKPQNLILAQNPQKLWIKNRNKSNLQTRKRKSLQSSLFEEEEEAMGGMGGASALSQVYGGLRHEANNQALYQQMMVDSPDKTGQNARARSKVSVGESGGGGGGKSMPSSLMAFKVKKYQRPNTMNFRRALKAKQSAKGVGTIDVGSDLVEQQYQSLGGGRDSKNETTFQMNGQNHQLRFETESISMSSGNINVTVHHQSSKNLFTMKESSNSGGVGGGRALDGNKRLIISKRSGDLYSNHKRQSRPINTSELGSNTGPEIKNQLMYVHSHDTNM